MGTLFSALRSAGDSMTVFERSLNAVQNNVANASTPGYASQTQPLVARRFQPDEGLVGGVEAGAVTSTRDESAELAVRNQNSAYGKYAQQSSDLSTLELNFDATGASGIPKALSDFFDTVSSWSVAPNDTSARQSVIAQANSLAQTFNQAAAGLASASSDVDQSINSTIASINELAAKVLNYNQQVRLNASNASDAGLDASIHQTLEDLSEYTDFTALKQSDGTYSVSMGGQTALVIGAHQYTISAATTSNNQTEILNSQGEDVTDVVNSGRLSSLIETKNQTIPGYLNSLNQLAAAVADKVNGVLATGITDTADQHPLFTYTSTDTAAATLATTNITADELAAAPPSESGGNSNVVALSGLSTTTQIDGCTFATYYGNLASQVGDDLSSAKNNDTLQQELLAQARTLRSDVSGVSLNTEAVSMIEFQRAYQANAQMVTVLNSLTQTVIDMMV
jgi:flagellar hook-associated protein 1